MHEAIRYLCFNYATPVEPVSIIERIQPIIVPGMNKIPIALILFSFFYYWGSSMKFNTTSVEPENNKVREKTKF